MRESAELVRDSKKGYSEGSASDSSDWTLEETVNFRLRRAHQRTTEVFNDVMGEFEITPTQFAALAKLDDVGPVSQNHLGRLTAMDPATIFGVVGRLMKRGYLSQSVDASDARLVMISLTPQGKEVVRRMKVRATEVSRRTLSKLSEEEQKTLMKLVEKIC